MSAKTCQLCGKPLGRMRVGGDGDFCSREHRNQFRLRKGMDRLQEANKVANLMRRRENPKHMPVAQLISSPVMERRGTGALSPISDRHRQALFPALRTTAFHPKVTGASRHASLLSFRSTPPQRREMSPPSFRPAGMSTKLALPAHATSRSVARLPQASIARLRFVAGGSAAQPRESAAALRVNRRAALERLEVRLETPGPASIEKMRRFQTVVATCTIAAAPRTSPGGAFERRTPFPGVARRLSRPRSGLPITTQPSFVALDSVDIYVDSLPCAMCIPQHPLRIPNLGYQVSVDTSGPQRYLRLTSPTRAAEAAAHRVCEGGWEADVRVSSLWLPSTTVRPAAFTTLDPVRSATGFGLRGETYRMETVPFTPSDWAFDYKPIALQGYLAAPRSEPAQPPVVIQEEDFNSGLERWTGETSDWRLDAAGARPAGLALFQPSLALIDYDCEFLARIEKRGVTWVFRASNHSNYHKITIGLAGSGRYELKRSVVIGGVEESAVVSPLGADFRAGSAFTVKTTARRNDFAISLEGEVVAHWTDGRLPAGGIGFTALRGDRARVYWVRLAPLGGLNLEAAPGRPARSIQ